MGEEAPSIPFVGDTVGGPPSRLSNAIPLEKTTAWTKLGWPRNFGGSESVGSRQTTATNQGMRSSSTVPTPDTDA